MFTAQLQLTFLYILQPMCISLATVFKLLVTRRNHTDKNLHCLKRLCPIAPPHPPTKSCGSIPYLGLKILFSKTRFYLRVTVFSLFCVLYLEYKKISIRLVHIPLVSISLQFLIPSSIQLPSPVSSSSTFLLSVFF